MLKLSVSNAGLFFRLQAVPLLRHFFVFHLPAVVKIKDQAVKDRLYAALRYGDVTGKATVGDRFDDIDADTLELMAEPFAFHDVAVSSGVTSLDLLRKLRRDGKQGVFSISDKFSEMEFSRGFLTRVYDNQSRLRSVYVFGVLFDSKLSWFFALSKLLYYPLSLVPAYGKREKVLLFSDAVLKSLKDGGIEYLRYDVFETKLENRFAFVRCMNLLNLSYFGEDRIMEGVVNLRDSLKEGGILLVGRTIKDGANGAGFYRREGRLLRLLRESHGGSEIRHLIERMNALERKRDGLAGRQ